MKHFAKKISFFAILFFNAHFLFAWAETGHRVIGEIAMKNIKNSTLRKINQLINYESLASISTFGDEIKSDKKYNQFYAWHFVNFQDGKTYEESEHNSEGDMVQGINFCIKTIKDKNASKEDKVFYLKMLVHLIGDLHQPLHVGHKEDKGGNDIKVNWFSTPSNLHRVWDENMIEEYNMSFTELANNLGHLEKEDIKKIQKGSVLDWVYESQKLSNTVYSSVKPEENLSYKYSYLYFPLVKVQLQKAGLRLAFILDDLFS